MARLKNTILDKTVNRKALTFAADVVSNTVNTNLEQVAGDNVVEQIDAAGLESEQSAADKFAFLLAALTNVKCELESKLAERYEVICHADTAPITFSVPSGATTTIPFSNLIYTPSDGHYSLGHFFVNKAGYYDVDVRFLCPPKTAPVTLISLSILGSFGGGTVDEVIIGTEILRLQGSLKIYCEVGDSIYAAVYQNSGVTILFSAAADTQAAGYISISYAGSHKAATF